MSRDENDRVTDFFAVASRDVTPASARHAAHVLYAPVSHDPDVSRHCASVLSETELRRADRFATEDDRVRFTQRRAFRRFCGATALGSLRSLPQIDFEETENGRPCLADLPDVWFSFSSCRFGLLGAWSWTHGIGVDLEVQTRNLEAVELAHRFFTETETIVVEGAEGLERQRTFVQFWSLKEAALKSIGEGLPFGLETFEFELEPDLRIVNAPCAHGGPERFDAYLLEGADVCAALVTRSMVCYDSDGEIPPWGVPQ